ncbi:hypothetical protein RDI58_022364 [Solanum bulbocastanum]|uniref:Uncharacterized protein n=1 Tax=Solanum bulbocastanum TaxID=147425 RepID=A0AAN8T3X6_SOLBU
MGEFGVNERILEDSPHEGGHTGDPMTETCSPSRIILGASSEGELGLIYKVIMKGVLFSSTKSIEQVGDSVIEVEDNFPIANFVPKHLSSRLRKALG